MKIIKYSMSILLISFCFVIRAQIVYVDSNNVTGIETGTVEYPFNTIEEGINAATPGNKVMINQGTYIPNDHILKMKAGVSLLGEGRENTIIDGEIVDGEVSDLSIGLEKLSFDGFSFGRGKRTTVGPFPDTNIIRDCATSYISLEFGGGMWVNDTTIGPNFGFLIENNNLGTAGTISFSQGAGISKMVCINNTCGYIEIKSGSYYTYLVDNNDVQYGIIDKSGSNTTTISNNRIYNGPIIDLSGGFPINENEIIENNIITADENSPAFADEENKAGIIDKSRSATIRNNIITCKGNVSGIRSEAGAPFNIIGNTITIDEVQQPEPDPYVGTIGIFNYSGWGKITGNTISGGNYGYFSKAGTVEFSDNKISKSFTGFYSAGNEAVHNNTIENCKGDGMILDGLRGPLYNNSVVNNAGAGIRVVRTPIDLGGGLDSCPGNNTLQGNGNFDLYVEASNSLTPQIYAYNNVWDHQDNAEILMYDIFDGNDLSGYAKVDLISTGIKEINSSGNDLGIKIFPNPSSGEINICWKYWVGNHISLKVSDLMGNEILIRKDEKILTGQSKLYLNATNLPNGVYFLKISSPDGIVDTETLVISR